MADRKFYPLKIADVRPETDTAVCLSFEIPKQYEDKFAFVQGQFLTLKVNIDGEEVRRSYSICSGIHDGKLRVGVKRVKSGKFSNYANDHFKPGLVIDVMPPQGRFFSSLDATHHKRYICIAVGSGITPILSIIKSVLSVEPLSRVSLIFGNRRSSSMMFKEELGFIKNRYIDRFDWINIMSQEDQGADILNGKIDNKKGYLLQQQKLIDIDNTDEVFICGPESMISEVSRGFRYEGLSDSKIHYELFASSAEDSQKILNKAQQRIQEYGEDKTSQITIVAGGRSIRFGLATVGENILDAGLSNGLELPYACKAGVCSTCKAKLVRGEVDMDVSHGLESTEIEAGYILCCQAHPTSDQVVVDFDQR